MSGNYIRKELSIHGKTLEENKAIFDALENQKETIETSFGNPLEWKLLSAKRMNLIKSRYAEYVFSTKKIGKKWLNLWDNTFQNLKQHSKTDTIIYKKIE